MEHIDYGLSILSPAGLRATDLPAGFEVHERFYEIGSPTGLEEFRRDFC